MSKAMIAAPILPDQRLFRWPLSGRHTFFGLPDVVETKMKMTWQSPRTQTHSLRPLDKQSDPPTYNSAVRRRGGRTLDNNKNREIDPLASYWRLRAWLPDDRHEQEVAGQPGRRPTPPAERALKNVEREFDYSLSEYGEVYSKLLDEIREKWNKKDDDGSWRAVRRLWEAYELVTPNADPEELQERTGRILKYLKLHYRSRLVDYSKKRFRNIRLEKKQDDDDKDDVARTILDDVASQAKDSEVTLASAERFESFRNFVKENYKGTRIDEMMAVIDAIENGAYKRRHIAADVGITDKRLATILRTLRDLGKKCWPKESGSNHIDEILDQLDDDTEPTTDDEDSE